MGGGQLWAFLHHIGVSRCPGLRQSHAQVVFDSASQLRMPYEPLRDPTPFILRLPSIAQINDAGNSRLTAQRMRAARPNRLVPCHTRSLSPPNHFLLLMGAAAMQAAMASMLPSPAPMYKMPLAVAVTSRRTHTAGEAAHDEEPVGACGLCAHMLRSGGGTVVRSWFACEVWKHTSRIRIPAPLPNTPESLLRRMRDVTPRDGRLPFRIDGLNLFPASWSRRALRADPNALLCGALRLAPVRHDRAAALLQKVHLSPFLLTPQRASEPGGRFRSSGNLW